MKIYVNGVLENSLAVSKTLGSNNGDLTIGRMNNPSYPYYVGGKIDDVRIYNCALTASEIQTLYAQ